MTQSLQKRLSVKDSDLSNQFQSVDHWKKFLIAYQYPELLEELNQVISNSSIPDVQYDDINSNLRKIRESPTAVPGIYDQEVVPSDAYVNMELGLPWGSDNSLMHALVKKRKFDNYGKLIVTEHINILIDTIEHEVELIDGTTETLPSNIIAKKMLSQVDEEGHRQLLLYEIIYYRRNGNAVHKDDAFFDTHTGIRRLNMTTKGW